MYKYKFFCLRYFLVPTIDGTLLSIPHSSPEQKIKIIQKYFLSNIDIESNPKNKFAVRISKENENKYYGKISKEKEIEIHEKTPNDIEEKIEADFPYSNFKCIADINKQLVIFEKKSGVIDNIDYFSINFSKAINSELSLTGFEINFEPMVKQNYFWNIINNAEKVYKVSFSLISPNIFGASSKANESLKELQKAFNNNKTNFSIENTQGNLKVPKNKIETYREYSDNGGGQWNLSIEEKGIKKPFKSSDKTVLIPIELENDNPELALDKAHEAFENIITL